MLTIQHHIKDGLTFGKMSKLKAVSLFSCGGIGDLGFKDAGIDVLLLSDFDQRRLDFASNLHPNAKVIAGDIRVVQNEIIENTKQLIGNDDLLVSLTPPCQGMSQNGINSLLKAVADGKREPVDERNYLVEPCFNIIEKLHPKFVFFENVTQALNAMLVVNGSPITYAAYFDERLHSMGYKGKLQSTNFDDYGIPQARKRLIGIYVAEEHYEEELDYFPTKRAVTTLKQAIGNLPKLDASNSKSASREDYHSLHKVQPFRKDLYNWVASTPEGMSAFYNNTCTACGVTNNDKDIYCQACNTLLPKPSKIVDGTHRLIKGFDTSYKRMTWNKPAHTVTTRSAFASSSVNLHPSQNRVLSLFECAVLQGINPFDIDWTEKSTGKLFPDFVLREVIGEAIPASFTKQVGQSLQQPNKAPATQLSLAVA